MSSKDAPSPGARAPRRRTSQARRRAVSSPGLAGISQELADAISAVTAPADASAEHTPEVATAGSKGAVAEKPEPSIDELLEAATKLAAARIAQGDSPEAEDATELLAKRLGATASKHQHYGYISEKDRYTRRLRRIEGQVRGITRMVDEEEYCINILTQISATTGALHAVALNLLEDHLGHCVFNSAATNPLDAQKRLTEASNAIGRLLKS